MLFDLAHIGGADLQVRYKGGRIRGLFSAAYLLAGAFLVFFGYTHPVPYLVNAGVLTLAIGGLLAWLGSLKRHRMIADTPTAMIRSAAQGYVELIGRCKSVSDSELLYFGRTPPCVWYQATIVERERSFGKNRTRTRYVHSEDTFTIEDDTGECVIDPEHAEVLSANETRWHQGSTHYIVKYLLPGERLYAIGDLHTLRAADGVLDRKAEVGALLREWKQDREGLLRRFDANQDGDVDVQEWQQAVAAAGKEVDGQQREMHLDPGIHLMSEPTDGRPFLLSNRDPDELAKRFKWWAWLHLTVFISASVWGMAVLLD
jgi:hypothetical protein